MSRPHKNKPFPSTLFDWTKVKTRHIFCFWILCNEFDSDEAGWIQMSRLHFNRVANDLIPVPVHNPTLILETLQEMGYIEFVRSRRETGWRDHITDFYSIRVSLNAWDLDFPVVNKKYRQDSDKAEDLKAFYKARYAKKKATEEARRLAQQT